MITRLLATGALAGALLLAGATAAGAVEYTGGEIDESTAGPGATVPYTSPETAIDEGTIATITIEGPQAAEEGAIVPASVLTGSVPFGPNGVLSFGFTVPASAQPGDTYSISITADDGVDSFNAVLAIDVPAVPGDAGPGDSDGLPETGGTDLTPVLWFGAGAVLLGAIAAGVVAVTRRNSRTSA